MLTKVVAATIYGAKDESSSHHNECHRSGVVKQFIFTNRNPVAGDAAPFLIWFAIILCYNHVVSMIRSN